MRVKYIRFFEDYQEGESGKPEPVKDEITDPEWILDYIKGGEPFCILSAYLPDASPEDDQRKHEALEKEILKNKYAYHAMAFRYRCVKGDHLLEVDQLSLFVPKMPLHLVLYLAKKYGQPTVAVRSDDGLDFISVEDESLLLSINKDDLKTAWCAFIFTPGAFLGNSSTNDLRANNR